jgi:3-oxoacyl-[acyl-carrier-protein] synthase III
MAVGILAVEYTLGSGNVTHEELEQRFGEEAMKKVVSGAGIHNRRVAGPGVCGSDLAFDAAQRLIGKHQIDTASIDLLIHCTHSPDYFMPSTACVLHDRLALKRQCGAFDVNLACSQYVYALSIASSMIQSGVATRALVLTGDSVSRDINPMDRSAAPLMGDGGSATLIGEVPGGQGFLGFELGTDGSGHKYLMIPAGAYRIPATAETALEATDAEGNVRSAQNFRMNGAAVFHFAITVVPSAVSSILDRLKLTMDDIDLVLFHQANQYMLDYLVKKLKIPPPKTHFFLSEIGNTGGTSLPTVLTEAKSSGKVKPGARILMVAFGAGLSWAATVMTWPDNAL